MQRVKQCGALAGSLSMQGLNEATRGYCIHPLMGGIGLVTAVGDRIGGAYYGAEITLTRSGEERTHEHTRDYRGEAREEIVMYRS